MTDLRARLHAVPAFAFGLALVAVYGLLRTLAAPDVVIAAWTIVACATALASPLGGLTVLAAIGPFTEALTADGRITVVPFLLAALGASLVVHVFLERPVWRPGRVVVLALALMIVTALGVLHTALAWGPGRGRDAFEAWLPGIGGGLTVLLVAAWTARQADVRPLAVGVASVALAGLVSLVDFRGHGVLHGGPLGWLLSPPGDPYRLTGVVSAPNAAATIFAGGLAVSLAALLFAQRRETRVLAGLASAVLLVAIQASGSRSGILAVAVVVGLLALRWRQRLGILVTIVLGMAGLLVASGLLTVRRVAEIGDQDRLDAWRASLEMWLAAPLSGQGFRAFEWLHGDFASPLDAPHNEWLRLMAEEGIAGGIGLVFAVVTLYTLLRSSDWRAYACGVAAAGLFLMACFNNPFIYVQVNAPAFLIVGSGLGVATARAGRRSREEFAA